MEPQETQSGVLPRNKAWGQEEDSFVLYGQRVWKIFPPNLKHRQTSQRVTVVSGVYTEGPTWRNSLSQRHFLLWTLQQQWVAVMTCLCIARAVLTTGEKKLCQTEACSVTAVKKSPWGNCLLARECVDLFDPVSSLSFFSVVSSRVSWAAAGAMKWKFHSYQCQRVGPLTTCGSSSVNHFPVMETYSAFSFNPNACNLLMALTAQLWLGWGKSRRAIDQDAKELCER